MLAVLRMKVIHVEELKLLFKDIHSIVTSKYRGIAVRIDQ